MRRYQQLSVWQRAMDLAPLVYTLTGKFPESEKFGLSQQMRRAAVSIASNIAEGAGRGSDKEFIRFLRIAQGSLQELETQTLLAARLGFTTDTQSIHDDMERLYAMISKLTHALSASSTQSVRRQTSDVRPQKEQP